MNRCALAVLMPLLAGVGTASADESWRITSAGYGPVRIGMSVAEASKALGMKLTGEAPVIDYPECRYLRPEPEVDGLWFMISNDRVVRVEVVAPGVVTKSGIGVGDSEAHVKEVLGPAIEVTPHAYSSPDGSYLTLWTSDRTAAVRFETLHGKVTSFYAGRAREVQYIEGCF